MQRNKSNSLHEEAQNHLAGGVNSPVRAFKSVHGNPIYFEKASGAIVTDVDGNNLVDFVQSCGPNSRSFSSTDYRHGCTKNAKWDLIWRSTHRRDRTR